MDPSTEFQTQMFFLLNSSRIVQREVLARSLSLEMKKITFSLVDRAVAFIHLERS